MTALSITKPWFKPHEQKSKSEQEIRSAFIRPEIVAAGWEGPEVRIRDAYYFTDGRMNIQGKTGQGDDPFDLICLVAYDLARLQRQERTGKVRQALDRRQAQQLLRVAPFKQYGPPVQVARAFGGREKFFTAVRQLSQQIYQVQ